MRTVLKGQTAIFIVLEVHIQETLKNFAMFSETSITAIDTGRRLGYLPSEAGAELCVAEGHGCSLASKVLHHGHRHGEVNVLLVILELVLHAAGCVLGDLEGRQVAEL